MSAAEHPGQILKTNYLEPLGLSPAEIARGMGVHRSRLTRLIQGKIPITVDTAPRLALFFDVPARWWMQMQMDFDLANAPNLREEVCPWDGLESALVGPKRARRLEASTPNQLASMRLAVSEQEYMQLRSAVGQPKAASRVEQVQRPDGSIALEARQ